MFSKSKKNSRKEAEQREQYEYARNRIQQKKGLVSHVIYFIAGAIMVVTLWTSKKARTVADTEIGLSRQDEGKEK